MVLRGGFAPLYDICISASTRPRSGEFKVVLLEVVISEGIYYKILQDRMRSLFIYKAKAVEVIMVQSR